MKKRMQTVMPAMLVMVAFLFFGSLSLQAQSFSTTGAAEGVNQNGKTTIEYMDAVTAAAVVKSEYIATFPANMPDPVNVASATTAYKMMFYRETLSKITFQGDVEIGILRAYNEIKLQSKTDWPNLVSESWYNDMVTLLSL